MRLREREPLLLERDLESNGAVLPLFMLLRDASSAAESSALWNQRKVWDW
jgi:hypothetical protein